MEEDLRVGKAGKAFERLSHCAIGRDCPVRIPRRMLDRFASEYPDDYLLRLERVCDAFRNIVAMRSLGTRIEAVGVGLVGGTISVVCMGVALDGDMLYAYETPVEKCGEGWEPYKRLSRYH